jgi:hypothetical protein
MRDGLQAAKLLARHEPIEPVDEKAVLAAFTLAWRPHLGESLVR